MMNLNEIKLDLTTLIHCPQCRTNQPLSGALITGMTPDEIRRKEEIESEAVARASAHWARYLND